MRIADVITGSRIVAAPIIVWLIFSNKTEAAYYLFAAAAITDLLDGYFARLSKKTTWRKPCIPVTKYGNTAAASIPIALAEAMEEDRVKTGSKILLIGDDSGFSLGVISVVFER